MKYFFAILAIQIILGCGNELVSYPKSYTFSHVDQSEEGLFVLNTPTSAISIPVNTGTYGVYRLDFLEESREIIKFIFDLQEIELLSEDMVRIHIITDEAVIDTIVTYTMDDENIIIEALADTDLIYYDSEEDAFILCGFTSAALPGPNANTGLPHYNHYNVEDCLEGGDLNDHLDYVLDINEYAPLDTIILFITKFIYK